MKTFRILLLFLAIAATSEAQIAVTGYFDTTDKDIWAAIGFYKNYLNEFSGKHLPNYAGYWSAEDCGRYKVPDHIVYSIASDYPTYRFGDQKTIFYVRKYAGYVHLKTMFSQIDSLNQITIFALTNHYVAIHDSIGKIHFISPLVVYSRKFNIIINRNITYHFPIEHIFNKRKSDSLLIKLESIEKAWDFHRINIDYYFADTKDEVAAMRGLDYYLFLEEPTPSGISFDSDRTIFCSGYGENYLH